MATPANKPIKKYTWVPKVGNNVSYRFGAKNLGYAAKYHTGTDIAANEGAKIVWAPKQEGTVVSIKNDKDGYGHNILVRSKNKEGKVVERLFAHTENVPINKGGSKLQSVSLKKGDVLSQGDTFGHVGNTGNSTGPHLHLEQTKAGEHWSYGNVVKPKLVYRAANPKRGAPTNPTLPFPPTDVGTSESVPPTSVGTPASAPPPTTDIGSGATPPQPTTTDPPVDPGTTSTDPNTGDLTITDPAAGEATPDPADEAAAGGATGTPPTQDTADNAGATDKSTLDTKAKGAVAKDINKINAKGSVNGATTRDVEISAAAIKSKSILAADRNDDGLVSKKEQRVLNPADHNNNGTVNKKEINKYVSTVDLNKDGKVKPSEAKAFRTLDSNDNYDLSKKEIKAYNSIAGKDGNVSRQEAKQALIAQIESKQDQREHDVAAEILKRTNEQKGGSQLVGEQASALAISQSSKPKNKDDDGPGKKKNKK